MYSCSLCGYPRISISILGNETRCIKCGNKQFNIQRPKYSNDWKALDRMEE